jgi:hypothetical protein
MEIKWYKYMKEGVNNKIKGDANAWLKRGDTLVIQGDMQGAVVGYNYKGPTVVVFEISLSKKIFTTA